MRAKSQWLVLLSVVAATATVVGWSVRPTVVAVDDLDSLREKQVKIKDLIERAMPATVAVTDGIGSGSGVIVSEDGLVLTAAHVLETGGESVTVIFADGREIPATPLGRNLDVDAGMLKLNEPGPWPFVPMADLSKVSPGDWCVAIGYPGGYQLGRTPPIRVGRVLSNDPTVVMSDSALIGGDSGGPLFNLDGEVIGIHSSIGASVDQNRHVPIALFERDWERLAAGETWGRLGRLVNLDPDRPMLGVQLDMTADRALVSGLVPGSPAGKSGVKTGDVVLEVDGQEIERSIDLIRRVANKRAGDSVELTVDRDGKRLSFSIDLARSGDLDRFRLEDSEGP